MLRISTLACLALCLFACGGQAEPAKPGQKTEPPDPHPETRKLRAADAVGYDGELLKQQVDQVIDLREKQKKDLEEAQKQGSGNPERD